MINEATARRFWPNDDPIGRRIKIGTRDLATWMTIIGVVKDVRNVGLSADIGYSAYMSFAQGPGRRIELVVRTRGNPQDLLATITAELHRLEPASLLERAKPCRTASTNPLRPAV
jgi:hypothetical protein